MAKKIKDLAAKTGSFRDSQGIEKGKYTNCGVLMQGDDGNLFILLERTFNPAGVPENGKETILISCFDPKDNSQQYPQQTAPRIGGDPIPSQQGQYAHSQAFQQPQQAQQAYYNQNGTPMTPQQVQAAKNGAPY
ncbi:hypothetical protein [Thiomicrorhabdus sp.]|uniref:hypothetical protein n=1 Tax=Thiomicrorhabdus sp. TaxID=2039724 RepID=UPI0029C6DDC7|nr:hypothetical protein [Thiomicrorhabdus sp.]